MNEINEQLIEQAKAIADKYAIATLKFEDKVDEEMMATFRAEAQIDRRGIIALAEFFLSAVGDGKLKLPGEVGRIAADMLAGGKGEVTYVRKGDVLIILRPEKGGDVK